MTAARLAIVPAPRSVTAGAGEFLLTPDTHIVALDSMAASRLDGAVIEYDPEEDGFLLEHPDAVTAVWCG